MVFEMMVQKRQFFSILLAMLLLLGLLMVISFDDINSDIPPERVELIELSMSNPPPPPPPPMTREDLITKDSLELSSSIQQVPVELMSMDLNIDLLGGELSGKGTGNWGESVALNSRFVDLGGLDGIPMIVTSPIISYPPELTEQGIESVIVKLHVMIDEQGNSYLINIIESSSTFFNNALEEYVSKVRYTPPTLSGVPVRTEFLWTLNIHPL